MIEIELTKEELELLQEELTNSKNSRLKEIRSGIIILLVSIIAMLMLWFLAEQLPIANKLMAVALFGIALGAYKSYWWYMIASIKKLERDINNQLKIQDESTIKSYSMRTHNVKLLNGFRMNDFDIQQQHWKVGDKISYEYTPVDNFILNTRIVDK